MKTVRYLGVDPGSHKLGIAVGDDLSGLAIPVVVLSYEGVQRAAERIRDEAARLGASCVVVGCPVSATGEDTPACRRSDALIRQLESLGLRVERQSELLSTNEARRRARQAGLSGNRPVDHIAAQVLLEDFLSRS
jgi:putative Holliday junction resolvase